MTEEFINKTPGHPLALLADKDLKLVNADDGKCYGIVQANYAKFSSFINHPDPEEPTTLPKETVVVEVSRSKINRIKPQTYSLCDAGANGSLCGRNLRRISNHYGDPLSVKGVSPDLMTGLRMADFVGVSPMAKRFGFDRCLVMIHFGVDCPDAPTTVLSRTQMQAHGIKVDNLAIGFGCSQ